MDNPPLPAVWHLGILGLSILNLIFNTQFLFESLRFMESVVSSQCPSPRQPIPAISSQPWFMKDCQKKKHEKNKTGANFTSLQRPDIVTKC